MKLWRILFWIIFALIALLVIVRLTMPLMLERSIVNWFGEQEITATVEDIRFNLGDGDFAIQGLKAEKQNEPVLNLDKITVGWSWKDLFDSRARVKFFKVDGLAFDIEKKEDGNLIVAGLDINQLSKSTPEAETTSADEDKEPLDWRVNLDELRLSNFDICYRQPDQDYCNHFDKLDWQGELKIDLSKLDDPALPIFVKGSFEIDALKTHDNILDRDLVSLERFSIEKIDINTLESAGLSALTLSDFNACYKLPDQDYCSHFDNLVWQGNVTADLSKKDDASSPVPVKASGNFEINTLQVHNNNLGKDLATLQQLSVDEIDIASLDDIAFKTLSMGPLVLLKRNGDELAPQVTRFDQIQLSEVTLKALQQLSIDQVTITDHELLLVNKADKTLELQEWLPARSETTAAIDDTPVDKTTPFQYVIKKFVYKTGKSIHYHDNSLEKPFVVDLNNISIQVENIDSSQPDKDSKIQYSAQYAEHGKISLEGNARPLLEKPSFDMSGRISGLDLRDISPFTSEAIGHSIKSGQLDADLKLKADNAILDSEVDLKLYHFELTALSPEDEEKLNADFGYPLNSSLSLLKDSDNTIELNIPVTGDLQNPDFDANDAITQATSSAITSAIISYYTPFGLVMAVEGIIDLASALDFEPVSFNPGENLLDARQKEELTSLVQLLGERPGIHLTVCSFTNTADRKIVLPETAEIAIEELKLTPEQIHALVQIGESRATSVKQFLVEQKIEASRLIICAPEHSEGEGLAGVEISI